MSAPIAAFHGGAAAAAEKAVFAGGCFWCMEEAFDKVPGVLATTSGYTGGTTKNPTYEQVTSDTTGHFEAVEVQYDPAKVTYEQLLDAFWRNVDPFDSAGQFCDKGSSYKSAIFTGGEAEQRAAEATRAGVAQRLSMPVATEVLPEKTFYPAEDYHQDYYTKNPAQYKFYKFGCGRAQRLEEIWGEPAA
jgi:peptide-methionine (S)-S-oxide reductase